MKSYFYYFILLLLINSLTIFSQQRPTRQLDGKKITITGTIVEKSTSQPLEYATIEFRRPNSPKAIFGGVTDNKGQFSVEINEGTYDIKYEFISFKKIEIKAKSFTESTNLGIIKLEEDAKQLNEVVVRAEKTTVDIKLDKKVYSVGKDILVRGGTVSDVLDNVPSVSVNAEGVVALRGNENVRILIDGKPANANSVNDALKMLSADAVDKVEIVTNPSARYDAEGGGGIINILLKKGKNQGVNGTLIVSAGYPENSSISANLNVKKEQFNFFTTIGYNKRQNPGSTLINQENLNPDGSLKSYIEERRDSKKYGQGANINFGIEVMIDKKSSWTNAFNYRNNRGGNLEDVLYYNYNSSKNFINTSQRLNDAINDTENVEYTTNFVKFFKKEGHKLSFDGAFGKENENENNIIDGRIVETNSFVSAEKTRKKNTQGRNLLQVDYVLPIGKVSQFEAGYRGNFINAFQDFEVKRLNTATNTFENVKSFTNQMNYIENVNALYTQFGTKLNKFSFLFGVRYENSHIEVNQLTSSIFVTKKYENFFPSAFLTYQLSDKTNISLNYSKRITRPRDRFINPFASYTSNINIFRGNPDINPAFSNVFDLGFLKKWDKLTLNASAYYNHTTSAFQFVRRESGDFVGTTPVIENTPFNLGSEDKTGFEFTLNYIPKKWITLNANFNFFNSNSKGDYTYINFQNKTIVQDFSFNANTWTSRLTSKIILPAKINWQTNVTYNAPQNYAQGRMIGILVANLGLSKDILKDMGTVSVNVSDLFNTRKRIQDLQLPTVNSYSEMQFRVRVITLSFTYRFNKKKTEKEQKPRQQNENGGDSDMIGG
ncbi:MAG: outer membrane beta-barrel family protein [Limnohabitans sp.]|nr:outer membrane beta-barrel family protein [Limnohabitans sp.]